MPHFEKRGAQVLELSGAHSIAIAPIVEGDSASRSAWGTWSVQNPWLPETYRPENVPQYAPLTRPEIFRLGEDGSPAPFVSKPGQLLYPVWQVHPILPSTVNLELLSTFPEVDPSLLDDVATVGGRMFASRGDEGENADPEIPQTWPTTSMFVPVFNDFDGAGKLSGLIVTVVPWHNFFRNILPEGTKMLLIIRSTCGPSFTYNIEGPNVGYVGTGDLHDPDFEDLELVGSFDGHDEASAYTAGDCLFEFSVYPTKEYYDSFQTKNPVYFTLTVVFIFFLTS